jgi:hypothetical protein
MTIATATTSPPSAPADERRPGTYGGQRHPALRRDRDEEEDEPGPERVGECDEDAVDREALRRREHGDGGDHRARARSEEEPKADAEQEPAARAARVPAAERLERPLQERAHLRPEEREPDDQDDADCNVEQEIVWEPERREERGGNQGEECEAPDEPCHDRVRPARASGCAPGEDDGQHREDAGRDRRGDERDANQQAHGVIMPA